MPQASASSFRAAAYCPASSRFTATLVTSAAEASTVMNTSTFPRETARWTRCFSASSAKIYSRGIFTVQSR